MLAPEQRRPLRPFLDVPSIRLATRLPQCPTDWLCYNDSKMAKKKNSSKKHRFKHTEPSVRSQVSSPAKVANGTDVAAANVMASTVKPAAPSRGTGAASAALQRDYRYVTRDVWTIAVLATTLVGLQLVLWYVMNHTGLGPAVYNLVKV